MTSKLVAADLVRDGVDADRITIVHGGSDHLVPEDPAQSDALLRRLGVPGEFLLTVSTLEPRKNVDRLLQAYARARPALPEPWPLVIVGPTGWGPVLTSPPEQEGVVFAGAVTDAALSGLYRRARAFAYVPLTEGYGLPPLEAMRMGTPAVIANEVPSVVDLDEPSPPPALIVDPLDVEGIAAALDHRVDRRCRAGRPGGEGRGARPLADLAHRRPSAHRAVEVAAGERRARWHCRSTSRPSRHVRRERATTPWSWRAGCSPAPTSP